MGSRRLIVAAVAALLLVGAVAAGAAPRHTAVLRTPAARAFGHMWGVVPAGRDSAGRPARPAPSQFAGGGFATASNLSYHGGPVMLTNTTYTIFWGPAGGFALGYEALINQFLGDVGAQSGSTTNVYASDTQYYDGLAPVSYISNSSTFAGSWQDTATAIPDHCSGQYAGTGVTVSGCVLDSDIQAEVARAIAANHWPDGLGTEYFVLTPDNVGSCYSSSGGTCSYTYYCAYHSNYVDGASNPVLYANQPYTDTSGVGAPGACDVGQHPNNNQADATINVLSHEHNESITDPLGSAWFDASGNENGDKCVWNFGTVLGTTSSGGEYNQIINGHDYWLQQEWSNASSSCVQSYAPAKPSIAGFSPSSGPVGSAVTITGGNFSGVTGVTINGVSASYTVNSTSQITAIVPSGATGSGAITVTTTAGTATSASQFTVTVNADFSLSASAAVTVARGGTAKYTITITRLNGFSGAVSLGVSGVPTYSSASFSPNPATATSSTLTVTTSRRSPARTYTLTITGTNGALKHTVQVKLTLI